MINKSKSTKKRKKMMSAAYCRVTGKKDGRLRITCTGDAAVLLRVFSGMASEPVRVDGGVAEDTEGADARAEAPEEAAEEDLAKAPMTEPEEDEID